MFSIIVTAYNSEKIINSTINKLINKNRAECFELIIVNDGSTDNTKNILHKYENIKNIKIINQINCGVSNARNQGLKHLDKRSEFVTFIDDSDTISENFIEESMKLFNKYPRLNVFVAPIIISKQNKEYGQTLNYRFHTKEEYVDIFEDYSFIHFHIGGVVFRTKLFLKNNYRFKENLSYWEDAYLINNIIINEGKYGLLKNSYYYYDRNNENSLSKIAWNSNKRYAYHIKENYLPLIKLSMEKYGYVIKYVQFLLSIHYLEFLLEHNQQYMKGLNYHTTSEFKLYSKKLLENIDLDIINNLNCSTRYKVFLYELKNEKYSYKLNYKNIKLLIHEYSLLNKRMVFSFSDDIGDLSNNYSITFIYKNNKTSNINVKSYKKVTMLGKSINDLSLGIFEAKIPIKMIIFGCKVKIEDTDNQIEVYVNNISVIKRIINRLIKKGNKNENISSITGV